MIAWAVSTEGVLTGYTESTSSQTFNFSEDPGSITFFAYTSKNTSGYTTSISQEGFGVYESPLYTDSGSFFLETIASQTSKTETFSTTKASTFATTSQIQAWTTSNDENEIIEFYQTSSTTNTWSVSSQSTTSTRDTTTTTNGTMIASATALVVQAKTDAPNAEIIYYASSALSWNGLSAASAVAQTATRITLANIISTIQAPAIIQSIGAQTFSWTNNSSTYSLEFTTTEQTTTQTTFVTNETILPNETSADTIGTIKTKTESISLDLWSSNSGQIGIIGTITFNQSTATTTSIQELKTIYTVPASFCFGSLSWNVLRTNTTSRSLIISTNVGFEGKTSITNEPFFDAAETSESGLRIESNIPLVLPPQVTTDIAQNASQSKFVPVFAQIASSRGQWFTVANSTFNSASFASVSRSLGKTIFPLTTTSESSGESYGLSRLTYVSGTGEQATTTTAALGVQGQSTTTAIPASPIGIVGGSPNLSETFAYGVGAAGVYKNRINGNTTSFDAGATTFVQSRPASFFEPVTALVPVVGTGTTAVFPLYWAVPRNSTALPPAMPPNA